MLKRRSETDGCAEARLGDQLIPLAMVVLLRIMSFLRTTVTQEEYGWRLALHPDGFIVEVTFLRQPDSGLEHPVRVRAQIIARCIALISNALPLPSSLVIRHGPAYAPSSPEEPLYTSLLWTAPDERIDLILYQQSDLERVYDGLVDIVSSLVD